VRFASFLFGGFITAILVNPPKRKMANAPLCSQSNSIVRQLLHSHKAVVSRLPGLYFIIEYAAFETGSPPLFSLVFISRQRDRRRRALLQQQNFDFLIYLGWSGCFTQSKHNIMKVVQS
jgi:hypothetical protein